MRIQQFVAWCLMAFGSLILSLTATAQQSQYSAENVIQSSTEPVLFYKQDVLTVSRSTIDATLMFDLQPVERAFDNLGVYVHSFIDDMQEPETITQLLHDSLPHYVMENHCNIVPTDYKQVLGCRIYHQYYTVLGQAMTLKGTYLRIRQKYKDMLNQISFHDNLNSTSDPTGSHRLKREVVQYITSHHYSSTLSPRDREWLMHVLILTQTTHGTDEHLVALHDHLVRSKRFSLWTIFLGYTAWKQGKAINTLRKNLDNIRRRTELNAQRSLVLANQVNMAVEVLNKQSQAIMNINLKLYTVTLNLRKLMDALNKLSFAYMTLTTLDSNLGNIRTGLLEIEGMIQHVEDCLRVIATHKANPTFIPPTKLKKLLEQIKEKISSNPRLQLPADPDADIWAYYQFMYVSLTVIEDYMVMVVSIPLLDKSLQVDLYRAYSLPALHPTLQVEFQYELESKYIGIANHGIYVLLPGEEEIQVCKTTQGYYCYFEQALYPADSNRWCIYALFIDNKDNIEKYCTISIKPRHQNDAINLDGFMWAISAFRQEKIHIRCLEHTYIHTVKPPLEVIEIPNGCEGLSASLYIPARSQITMVVDAADYVATFTQLNYKYTNLSSYHVFIYLKMDTVDDIPEEEREKITSQLTSMPRLSMELFKRKFENLEKDPFMVPPALILAISICLTIGMIVFLVFMVWQLKKNKGLANLILPGKLKQFEPLLNNLLKQFQKPESSSGTSSPPENPMAFVTMESGRAIMPLEPTAPSLQPSTSDDKPPLPDRVKKSKNKKTKERNITPQIASKVLSEMKAQGYKVELPLELLEIPK